MNSAERDRYSLLIDIALLMAQELQEFVDEAVQSSGDDTALSSVQDLLGDWEEAYKACELGEEDHFQLERAAADRITPWRYPPEMPPEGARVLFTYRTDDGESDPIVGVYNKGYYETYCQPLVRWMAIPGVQGE